MLIDRMRHGASKIIEVTKIRALPIVQHSQRFSVQMNHGSLTPVNYSKSTGVMSILFSLAGSPSSGRIFDGPAED
jgi:hypothetical protein